MAPSSGPDDRRLWREYCGAVQLPMREFLDIQHTLLSEQLDLVARGIVPNLLSDGPRAKTVEEFRRATPLRRWSDYAPILQPAVLNGIASEVACWVETSWAHGSWKRVPWTRRFYDAQCRHVIASLIMSVARYAEDVRINKDFRVLPFLPSTPFASAWVALGVIQRNVVSSYLSPPSGEADLTMPQQIQAMLRRSLESGVDSVVGMASSLLMARRELRRLAGTSSFLKLRSEVGTRAALRWGRAKLRLLGSQESLEPKSLFRPKSVVTWGADTTFLTPAIEAHWGAPVFQLYASSEGGIMAMQDWRRRNLVPLPTSVFWEFLPAGAAPEAEAPVLLDELEVGKFYEPVITSFYGMPFLRLLQGDLLQVTGHNQQGCPEIRVHGRSDGIIDLGSIARIDQGTLGEAAALVGLRQGQWTARKEYLDGRPLLCFYAEADLEDTMDLERKLHRAIGKVDPHYREASYTLGYQPLRVFGVKAESLASEEALVP